MLMMKQFAVAGIVALAAVGTTQAKETDARDGNAIVPLFSLQHEALEPLQMANLVACITNGNPRSTRELGHGDSFRFNFADGRLARCAGVDVFSRGGGIGVGDFDCSVDGSALVLTYLGDGVQWQAGDSACALVDFEAGQRSSTVLTALRVGHHGSYAATQPSVLFLSVAPGIGIVGPAGPAGPMGPRGASGDQGPRGESGAGSSAFVTSTDAIRVSPCDEPSLVPGLEASIDVAQGSRLLVHVDVNQHDDCPLPFGQVRSSARLDLELDGARVASRDLAWVGPAPGDGATRAASLVFRSEQLDAGLHSLRVILDDASGRTSCSHHTLCVGSAENDKHQARMVVLELLYE